jgi:tetratricopeptide (TPR) repeat protein
MPKALILVVLLLWPLTPALAQGRSTVARANQAYQAQDFAAAVTLYEAALAQNPADVDLHFFLANSYDQLYRPSASGDAANDRYLAQALAHYQRAAERARTPALRKLSNQYLVNAYVNKTNEPGLAEVFLQRMIADDPDERRNYFVLARLYEDARNAGLAEQQLTIAKERWPDDPSVYMELAGFYQRQRNFDKMIAAVEERAERDPNNPEAFYTLATFYWEKATRDVKLPNAEKANYAQAGLAAVNKALDLKNDYFEALTYKNLLLRTQANISTDPAEQQRLLTEADDLRKQAEELRNAQRQDAAARNTAK